MAERDAVLFANSAFYTAFSTRDLEAMDEAWSSAKPISCIHPGWNILYGRDEVLRSWHGIMRNPNSPKVKTHNERVVICGEMAVVTCVEELNGRQFAIATNVFVKEGHTWRLVHHQAGPANVDPASLEPSEDERPRGPVN
ncbi:MAG: nuclear transport factor 2 family protein [Rhodospirillaceae bacterium]|nr:nuclear transport factor 2 family protein [Rhodospirillaceae bacterium]